jgi:hypothetical protein
MAKYTEMLAVSKQSHEDRNPLNQLYKQKP